MKPEITQARLKELLHYDPGTGVFTWRVQRGPRKPGDEAGAINTLGYRVIRLDYGLRLAHRLAYIYQTGSCPAEVDHINQSRSDNRWRNLRPATKSQNQQNSRLRKDNTSGYRGVHWVRAAKKWQATGVLNGTRIYLGLFACRHEAAQVAKNWRKAVFADRAPQSDHLPFQHV